MAAAKGQIKVNCPSCGNTLALSGVRGATTLNCPYCKMRIRITVPSRPPPGAGYAPETAEDDIDIYEKDIKFSREWPIIKNIALKDFLSLRKLYLVMFIISIIIAIFLSPQANSIEKSNRESEFRDNIPDDIYLPEDVVIYDDYYDAELEQEETLWEISFFYGIIIIASVIIMIIVLNYVYGVEVKRGTIRLLCMYPINMNGITIAKIISSILIMGIIMLAVLVIPMAPFMGTYTFPWLDSIILMVFIINIFIIITCAFGSQIITYFTNKLYLSMHRFIALMVLLYLFLTETVISMMGVLVTILKDVPATKADELMHNYNMLGQDLGKFSPYHSGGRILTNAVGYNTGGPDILFVLLIGIILIITGYILGRKIYLDVFIREG